jgi:hypothetical protein
MKLFYRFSNVYKFWKNSYIQSHYSNIDSLYDELKVKIERKTLFNLLRIWILFVIGIYFIFKGGGNNWISVFYLALASFFYFDEKVEKNLFIIVSSLRNKKLE